jgi:DNA-binding CsgD family transcriptional regulator/uncharacterized membrane protein (UPF0127 family)
LAKSRRSTESDGKRDGVFSRKVSLSPREWEIFRELARGATNPQIAERLGVSVHTVKSHVKRILLKLNASNRTAATAWYFAHAEPRPDGVPGDKPPRRRSRVEPAQAFVEAQQSAPENRGSRGSKRALVIAGGEEICLAEVADTHFTRARGLLGWRKLDVGKGLWVRPCRAIHTFFLKFPIDVAYLASDGTVVKTSSHVRPFRFSVGGWRARSVLELPAGFLDRSGLKVGDGVTWSPVDGQAKIGAG